MKITVLQTSDAIFYFPMLHETSKTVRALCARHGLAYEQYVGIKRGHMPWQSSYNRVFMLKEMIDRGVQGWVLYLDADAFVQDIDFDIASYFEERASAAAIFAGYGTSEDPYDINSGGFAINLSHPLGRAMVMDWFRSVVQIPDDIFDVAVYWEHDLANDQYLLWLILHHYVEEVGVGDAIIFERANQSYVNNGPFISQFLRAFYPTFEERLAAVRRRVAEIMATRKPHPARPSAGVYLPIQHPKLVSACGRKTAAGLRSTGEAGGLMFGPYISMPAGRYLARIFGAATLREGQEQVGFGCDVATDRGFKVPARQDVVVDGPVDGIICEMPFELPEDVSDLEVRVVVGPDTDMVLHAVQIIPA